MASRGVRARPAERLTRAKVREVLHRVPVWLGPHHRRATGCYARRRVGAQSAIPRLQSCPCSSPGHLPVSKYFGSWTPFHGKFTANFCQPNNQGAGAADVISLLTMPGVAKVVRPMQGSTARGGQLACRRSRPTAPSSGHPLRAAASTHARPGSMCDSVRLGVSGYHPQRRNLGHRDAQAAWFVGPADGLRRRMPRLAGAA